MKARASVATSCFVASVLIVGSLCFAGPALPELPDAASDTAKDVLDQLAAGTIPPVPDVLDGAPPSPGPGDLALPQLPDAASDTAKDVLDQLAAGIIPPVPSVVDGAGSAFVSGAQIPEPLTLTLLAIGGLALIRRRR